MAVLKINFDEVPDEILPVSPGIHLVEIKNASWEENRKKDGYNLVVEMVVVEDGPDNGRSLRDWISDKREGWKTTVKRLGKSCGLTLGAEGLMTEDLIGRQARVVTEVTTLKGQEGGQDREVSSVVDYLPPEQN